MNGYFNSLGHPMFKIAVYGYHPKASVQIDAMFDTGFTGFLSLPLKYCLQSGLILLSTAEYTLADNSRSSTLLCLGTVVLDNKTKVVGTISISFKSVDTLLGMDFLRKLKGKLDVDTVNKSVKIVSSISSGNK